MKMQIDSNACTGHGRCYTLAPHLVEPDDMGYAVPSGVPIDIDPADEALAKKLVGTCPEGAISVQ
ncbi:ferredoxin [Rhodococcoides yunnanense]|jgi:ferredoxin|uniref:ferredoxin n=1 Tax=Rhodococcoides yunnanense TaxID=278209 RepID=UPI0022B1835F|nr:ferredoxin [Rhodococcus yunnanensis]MCZ4278480.1 ferredoxin [Rhodococcus yunnanensis]